jgi:hypothetical protein
MTPQVGGTLNFWEDTYVIGFIGLLASETRYFKLHVRFRYGDLNQSGLEDCRREGGTRGLEARLSCNG